jgi:DNA-directed RNA polymerase I subunit RPA34.5
MIVPAKPFRPPNGFQEIQPGLLDFTSDTLKTVSKDLTGKQVWHITAPASIPMSSITVFDVDAVRRGDPVFVHRKKQYCFSPSANDVQHLLLPSDTGSTYKRLKTTITKSYHLREFSNQFTSTRSENEKSPEAIELFAKEKPDCKPAPKQPTLLRTRYKPFGTDGSPPASTRINGTPVPEEDNIQITLPNSSSPPGSTPKRKEKKSRRPKLSDQNGPENDSMEADVSSVQEMMLEVANSQIGPSLLETPKTTIGVVENEPTTGKKKRKKKKSVEQPSA